MPEYDAFGREIGEDTLAESGWTSGQQAPAPPQPPPVPQPVAPGDPLQPAPTATQQVAEAGFRDVAAAPLVTRRRGFGCGGAVGLVMLLVVGAIGAGVWLLFSAAEEAVDEATRLIPKIPTIDVPSFSVPTPPTPADPADPTAPKEPPKGLRRGSLLKRANFARAMRRLRAARLGNLRSVRVAPDRIDVQLLTKGGALRHAQVSYDGRLQKFGSAAPGFGHLDTFPYSSVDTAVPERLTRAAAKRLGKGADNVDYLVKIGFSDQLDWAIFFKGGANFQADSAGRIVRRVS